MSELDALLSDHQPTDLKETRDLRRMQMLAGQLEAPFSRSQWPAHFTGSALVVTPDGNKVCLLHHGKLNRWLQPGGHSEAVDEGRMLATALREATEETGLQVRLHPRAPVPLDVDIHCIPAKGTEPEHDHLDVRFLLEALNPEALSHDPEESKGIRWLSWEEALRVSEEPAFNRLLNKGLSFAATE